MTGAAQAGAVSRVLARGGRRPLPSGTPYSRQGLRVKRSSYALAIVVADYDSPTEAGDALADAADLLREAGYIVGARPDKRIVVVEARP